MPPAVQLGQGAQDFNPIVSCCLKPSWPARRCHQPWSWVRGRRISGTAARSSCTRQQKCVSEKKETDLLFNLKLKIFNWLQPFLRKEWVISEASCLHKFFKSWQLTRQIPGTIYLQIYIYRIRGSFCSSCTTNIHYTVQDCKWFRGNVTKYRKNHSLGRGLAPLCQQNCELPIFCGFQTWVKVPICSLEHKKYLSKLQICRLLDFFKPGGQSLEKLS